MSGKINKYYQPAQMQLMNTFAGLPTEALARGAQGQQSIIDQARKDMYDIGSTTVKALEQDRGTAKKIESNIRGEIDKILETSDGDLFKARDKILKLRRNVQDVMHSSDGLGANIEANFAKAHKYWEEVRKTKDSSYRDQLIAASNNNFKGTLGEDGSMRSFGTFNAVEDFDATEAFSKATKGIEKNALKNIDMNPDGTYSAAGWVASKDHPGMIEKNGVSISKYDLNTVLTSLNSVANDPKFHAFKRQLDYLAESGILPEGVADKMFMDARKAEFNKFTGKDVDYIADIKGDGSGNGSRNPHDLNNRPKVVHSTNSEEVGGGDISKTEDTMFTWDNPMNLLGKYINNEENPKERRVAYKNFVQNKMKHALQAYSNIPKDELKGTEEETLKALQALNSIPFEEALEVFDTIDKTKNGYEHYKGVKKEIYKGIYNSLDNQLNKIASSKNEFIGIPYVDDLKTVQNTISLGLKNISAIHVAGEEDRATEVPENYRYNGISFDVFGTPTFQIKNDRNSSKSVRITDEKQLKTFMDILVSEGVVGGKETEAGVNAYLASRGESGQQIELGLTQYKAIPRLEGVDKGTNVLSGENFDMIHSETQMKLTPQDVIEQVLKAYGTDKVRNPSLEAVQDEYNGLDHLHIADGITLKEFNDLVYAMLADPKAQ